MRRQLRILGLFWGLCILAAAQETRGSLSGIVSDGSGAVVARASLQLTNTETGVVLTTISNEAGLYRFLFLNPGQYKLVASIAGFKTFERDRIQLNVSEVGHSSSGPGSRRASRADHGFGGSAADRSREGRSRHGDRQQEGRRYSDQYAQPDHAGGACPTASRTPAARPWTRSRSPTARTGPGRSTAAWEAPWSSCWTARPTTRSTTA